MFIYGYSYSDNLLYTLSNIYAIIASAYRDKEM